MSEAKSLPVLFVTDTIVLPGMVVPIALDDAAQAAIDAARASDSGELLIAPRLEDRADLLHLAGRHDQRAADRSRALSPVLHVS